MFAAEPPQEPLPYGRWAEALADHFNDAAREIETEEDLGEGGEIVWFPDRTWNGRTYVPATCATSNGFELFGYVSYAREHEGAQATDFAAVVDFTDETADANPDWKLDLSDQEIGHWRGPEGRRGVVTLVWGVALVPNGAVATTELGPTTTDQCIARRRPLHAGLARRLHGRLRGGAALRAARRRAGEGVALRGGLAGLRSAGAPIAQLDRATPS